jgi:hypothetical protein
MAHWRAEDGRVLEGIGTLVPGYFGITRNLEVVDVDILVKGKVDREMWHSSEHDDTLCCVNLCSFTRSFIHSFTGRSIMKLLLNSDL